MKKLIVITWLTLLISAVAALFWYNDLVYHLPTPVPVHYVEVQRGSVINLNGSLSRYDSKPVFLHFFNPACPCSRFNALSFKSLVGQYDSRVTFIVVVMSNKKYSVKEIQDKLGVVIQVSFDASIAFACGVYSTPQAVLLDAQHKLYYRGNYNSSRYCTNEKTSFAKIAIDGLLNNQTGMNFNPLALKAYGCRLPGCTN
jgi:hypothetical protein